jgi:hypothetical protein
MRKILFKAILVFLMIFLSNASSFGQGGVNILKLKKFFENYEAVCNLAPADTTSVNQMANQFRTLFLNDEVPVYYDLETTTTYEKKKLNDYIQAMRSFAKRNVIEDISIVDFEVTRVLNNGIINVKLTKNIEYYYPRGIDVDLYDVPRYIITNKLFITLFYTNAGTYKILRIDRADYLFADGLGSSRFIPYSVAIEPSVLSYNISNNEFDKNGFKPGWAVVLKANYPVIGKEKFNLLFSPGINLVHVNSQVEKSNFNHEITGQVDQDGDPYILKIEGNDLQQAVRIGYIGIPVDLTGIWKFNKTSLALSAGLAFDYPISSNYMNDKADITYSGLYDFEGYPIELHDLPQYGYQQYSESEFAGIVEPDLSPILLGHTSLTAGFDLNSFFTLSLGPELYFSFNDLIKEHTFPALIDENGAATSPNILSYGDKNDLFAWGLNIGLTYHFKRPNVPYVKNIKFNEINDQLYKTAEIEYCPGLQTTNIKSTPLEINFFIENDPKLPGNIKKVPYYYCGVTKANSKKGQLKAGKNVSLSLNMPQDDRKSSSTVLRIEKPYGIDIYRHEYEQNPDNLFFELPYSELKDQKESITLYAKQIPPVDIYYVSFSYNSNYELLNQKAFLDEMEDIILDNSKSNLHELVLYSAYNADTNSYIRTLSDDKGAIDDFKTTVSKFPSPTGEWLNDIDMFKKYLSEIPCDRRDVNLHFILASPNTYTKYMSNFIDTISNFKFALNYSNVKIFIYTPFESVHREDARSDEKLKDLMDVYDGKPRSYYNFDYHYRKLFNNK